MSDVLPAADLLVAEILARDRRSPGYAAAVARLLAIKLEMLKRATADARDVDPASLIG
jgi:hypothetical protein